MIINGLQLYPANRELHAIITVLLTRHTEALIARRLQNNPAVAILGPRQCGKTTLAWKLLEGYDSVYLDLESPRDRDRIGDPEAFFARHKNQLVVLDEVQRVPDLFMVLRGMIDQNRRRGKNAAQYLLLGSASNVLLKQSESLAGRVSYIELGPLTVLETSAGLQTKLWLHGGFPQSFLSTEGQSMTWRIDFIRTYLERDVPSLGPRIPATTLLRFWTMLAHCQGGLFNAADLGRSLAVDSKTVGRYLDLLCDLMLVRRLQPYLTNVGKRLVKAPRVFIRDSGLVHALLDIPRDYDLLGHPVVGRSWEGFVIENLIAAAPLRTVPFYYRTADGAEIDLLLSIPGQGLWAIEIKLGQNSKPKRGFHLSCDDIGAARRFVVNPGNERLRLGSGVEMIGLREMAGILAALESRPAPEPVKTLKKTIKKGRKISVAGL